MQWKKLESGFPSRWAKLLTGVLSSKNEFRNTDRRIKELADKIGQEKGKGVEKPWPSVDPSECTTGEGLAD